MAKKITPKITVTKKAPVKRTKAATARPKREAKTSAATNLIHGHSLQAAQLTLEKKATNVKVLDLREITSMTDYFIIASASSDIQVKAIADHVLTTMREKFGVTPWKSEGWDARHWIIVDFVDFVVHIFLEEFREYYNLERLWADAPTEIIDDTPKKKVVKKAAVKKPTVKKAVAAKKPAVKKAPAAKKKTTTVKAKKK